MPASTQLRDIFDALGDGLFVADAQGRYVDVNPAACRMMGRTREDLLSLTIRDVLDPAELPRLEQTVIDMSDGVVRRGEWRFRRGDGSVFVGELVGGQLPDGMFQSIVRDVTERVDREAFEQTLRREAAHRTKNVLSVVQVVLRQSAAIDPADFVGKVEDRLAALGASHDLFVRAGWQAIDLADLVRSQLAPFIGGAEDRLALSGPPISIGTSAAQTFGMALHELATNAAKYGALSNERGEIAIDWVVDRAEAGPTFTLCWRERNGPTVRPPERTGFGTTMIAKITSRALRAETGIDYAASGLVWTLRCPMDAL